MTQGLVAPEDPSVQRSWARSKFGTHSGELFPHRPGIFLRACGRAFDMLIRRRHAFAAQPDMGRLHKASGYTDECFATTWPRDSPLQYWSARCATGALVRFSLCAEAPPQSRGANRRRMAPQATVARVRRRGGREQSEE